MVLSISFVFSAVTIEQSVLGQSLFGNFSENIATIIRLLGYIILVYALLIDPLQKAPNSQGLGLENKNPAFLGGLFVNLKLFLPFGALVIALLLFRKATTGLERHLKQSSFAFFFLFLSETLSLASFLRDSTNINVYNLTASFGPVWIVEKIFLLLAVVLLGRWVWSYLVKRVQSQLFMIFTTSVLIIFLVVSISFTFLLVRNIEDQTLSDLETATKVLNYSLDTKKSEVSALAEVFSNNPAISNAVVGKNHEELSSLLSTALENKQVSSITITSDTGLVLARAEDPDNWGDSLSSDPLVRTALIGKVASNFVSKEGVVAPVIYLQAARPIIADKKVTGSVLVSITVGNSFLDGIKSSTGLDSSVYSGNTRSATTLVMPNGKDRWVGVKEENSKIKDRVLENGQTYKGSLSVLNRPFLAVYQPLKDVNNEVIGMSFTGQPQVLVLTAAGRSIELTFLISVLLLLISVVPAYLISKHISDQIH